MSLLRGVLMGGCLALVLMMGGAAAGFADDGALVKDLRAVAAQGAGSPAARAAWEKLVARGPAALTGILEAMDTTDTVAANWLRTAFDRIVEVERKNGGQKIDVAGLLTFVNNPARQGRARRLALEVVEQYRPGTTAKLTSGWLDDPEFRYEAVEMKIKGADAQLKQGSKDAAVAALRLAFSSSRDLEQARNAAARLKEQGVTVSVAAEFGFLLDWYLIGPFDAKGMKGFKTPYPPEQGVDLKAELTGKEGKLRWKRHEVREATAGLPARAALVNLPEALGHAEDAVAYAYTRFTVPEARAVEFRGAADDNLTVWVNGERVFGFEEYRNGVRLDRHRFKAKLKPGVNTVLVKICQAPSDPTNKEPNWEFLLRVVDGGGKGLPIKSALPAESKR